MTGEGGDDCAGSRRSVKPLGAGTAVKIQKPEYQDLGSGQGGDSMNRRLFFKAMAARVYAFARAPLLYAALPQALHFPADDIVSYFLTFAKALS